MHAISPSSHPVIYRITQIAGTLARTVYAVAIKCFAAFRFLFTQGKQLFQRVVNSLSLDLWERIGRPHRSQEIRRRQPMGHRADPSKHKLQIPLQVQNLEERLWEIVPTLMKEDQRLGAERLKDPERVAQMRKEDKSANPGAQIVSWLNRIQLMADYDTKKHIIEE
ncbi:MAG: hypothetical protein EB051_01945, partial [Chlamydiia bacterium]|nr:hypothetical protein [Chlamydiia bacterium]